jgi:hypothetical protein
MVHLVNAPRLNGCYVGRLTVDVWMVQKQCVEGNVFEYLSEESWNVEEVCCMIDLERKDLGS